MGKIGLLCLLLTCNFLFAQDTAVKKGVHYFGLHQVVLLAGSSGEKIGVLTTNGIRKNNWYAGISTGIDWYGIRSIPLLVGVHKAFGKSRHQPFLYGNTGIEFVWMDDYKTGARFETDAYDYRNGFSAEGGIGYFIHLKNNTALSLSAGFSYKAMGIKETTTQVGVDPFLNNNISNYKFYYRRIAIRIGLKI